MGRWLIDVSIVHPTSPYYMRLERKSEAMSWIARREQAKMTKFRALALEEKRVMVPFVMESYGQWGILATAFLRTISREVDARERQARAWYGHAIRAISFALQKGNAHVHSDGIMRIRSTPTANHTPRSP